VADPGCLSRIPDPDLYPSRISDPGSKNSYKREMKKNLLSYFFLSHKFHKIEYYAIFEMLKKKFRPIFQIVEVFTQKIFNMLSNIWVWDPRSGIRKKPIPDPGSGGQKGTGSRIRIRNTAQNCAKQAMRKFTATTAFTRTTWKYS
jgi:hypothetical protein